MRCGTCGRKIPAASFCHSKYICAFPPDGRIAKYSMNNNASDATSTFPKCCLPPLSPSFPRQLQVLLGLDEAYIKHGLRIATNMATNGMQNALAFSQDPFINFLHTSPDVSVETELAAQTVRYLELTPKSRALKRLYDLWHWRLHQFMRIALGIS